jgi:oligopeptide/dipeptide ABC transporter ATP-binding protein
MVYQNSFEATNPRFTARQVVSEPLQYFRLAPKSEQRHTVEALLRQVGIPEVEADKKVYEFSGGQLQRICIARALAAQPEVLLLDEPLSSLDVSVQAQILNLLRDLQEALGLTYVLISHDLEMVYNLADHLAILFAGTLVEEITDLKQFSSLCHPYTKLLLAPVIAPAESAAQAEPEGEGGCVYAHRCPNACDRCRAEAPALRELSPGHRAACHFAAP